jgi:hypothetical protein
MKTITRFVYPAFPGVAAITLACFCPLAHGAGLVPPPDGGYAGNNTAEGTAALFGLTTGIDNTALGFHALNSNRSGSENTATGYLALHVNIGATDARGGDAGSFNTANGSRALSSNRTGNWNTATGAGALLSNISGIDNTAIGFQALYNNINGNDNTANGWEALFSNATGRQNTATGADALSVNTDGDNNTALGYLALAFSNASNNTAVGGEALDNNINGNDNTAVGFLALYNSTGSSNVAVGFNAGSSLTTGGFNIDISNGGAAADAGTIRIGRAGEQTRAFIAGIHGVPIANSAAVVIDANGHLGTVIGTSSQRFKNEIKPMGKASEAILALNPVTFRYKEELDPQGLPQFGLVAEEVEKINPDLITRDASGKPYTVRYEAINAMLLNEFLKEHRKVEEQQATIAHLKRDFQWKLGEQAKQIEALTATLQKVSAQFQAGKIRHRTNPSWRTCAANSF